MLTKCALVLLAAMALRTIAAADQALYTSALCWLGYFNHWDDPIGADQLVYVLNSGYVDTPLRLGKDFCAQTSVWSTRFRNRGNAVPGRSRPTSF
jgi:hypothetical protein